MTREQMKVRIKTQATLKGMDKGWDLRQQAAYIEDLRTEIAAKLAEIGAKCEYDDWDEIIVTRKDGRGLVGACRAIARSACGVYSKVWAI